jgi:hypothetical protein
MVALCRQACLHCDREEAVMSQSLGDSVPVVTTMPSVPRVLLQEVGRAAPGARGKHCRCGHGKKVHQHYRRGTDCALCDCGVYRRPWPAVLGLGRR